MWGAIRYIIKELQISAERRFAYNSPHVAEAFPSLSAFVHPFRLLVGGV